MDELKYTIAEASERLEGISYRTLHYYEQKIGLNIARDGAGNRIYSEHDIELYENIVALKKKGMTLDGIKALFQERGLVETDEERHIVVVDEKALEMKDLLISEIRLAVSMQIKEDLAETNSKLDILISENQELKNELSILQRKSEDHYSKIDQQITQWRERKNQDNNKPWYKRFFDK